MKKKGKKKRKICPIKEKPERGREVLLHLDALALSFGVTVRIRH